MEVKHIVLLLLTAAALVGGDIVVQTAGGKVRGFQATSRSGRPFLAFTGIPFAKPPVGQLRFQPPEEADPWEGTVNSTDDRPVCLQYNSFDINPAVVGAEDCLYLSVFTHKVRGHSPVMVHIHGGGFISGYGLKSENMKFLMDEDVVIVDIQYRLGIMGFLSFQDEDMPGNQGMKDQVMALRWVKKNIARFGGNPDKVTIFGESAGSASVTHHTVSPLSKGLFHRAIAESGASYSVWTLLPPSLAKSHAYKLASLLKCPVNSTKQAVACLLKKDAAEIVGHLAAFRIWEVNPLTLFQPVLEPEGPGAFLSGPISHWKHSKAPLLIGMTPAEGLLMSAYFVQLGLDFNWYNDNFDKVAPLSMLYYGSASDPDEVTRKIRNFYFGDNKITSDSWVNITNAHTDSWFTAGVFEKADKHSGPVQFYFFDYLGDVTTWKWNKTLNFGAGHAEEVIYLWYADGLTGEDLELSKNMVKLWTGFAKTGRAAPPDHRGAWKRWTSNRHHYMHISHAGFTPEEGLLEDRYHFWKNLDYRSNYNQ